MKDDDSLATWEIGRLCLYVNSLILQPFSVCSRQEGLIEMQSTVVVQVPSPGLQDK